MNTALGAPQPAPNTVRQPLLATKLFAPSGNGELIERQRLIERLDAGARGRITIISAPAGFGKTTLARAWHAAHPDDTRLAWFSIDAADNEPARFLAYLCTAIQYEDPLLDATLQPADKLEIIGAGLVNALHARQEPVLLVLDDYHSITNPDIHGLVGRLIENAPPQLHVVLTSRTEPPVPLARLRARHQLNELHADALRFNVDEIDELFSSTLALNLDRAVIEQLADRTEGWAAGLILAGISLQRRSDVDAFLEEFSGSNRFVFDYLAEEVLRRQPEELRDFLLQTALLDRVCASLANALTGRSDGQQALEAVESANLFITPLDDERRWYRYHHLFAEFLAGQLQERDPELVRALHSRASAWFHARGFGEEAVEHALRGADYKRAVTIIRQIGAPLMMRGQPTTVRDWIKDLPHAELAAEPNLCLLQSGAFIYTGELNEIPPLLELADAWLKAHPDDPTWTQVTGRVAALWATFAFYKNDPDAVLRYANTALEHLPPDDLTFVAITTFALGTAVFVQDFKAGRDIVEQSIPLLDADGNYLLGLHARIILCSFYMHEGRLHDIERICQDVERSALGWGVVASGLINMTMAEVLQEWNRLDEAEQRIFQAEEIAHRQGILTTELLARGRLACIRMSQGRLQEALQLFNQIDADARRQNLLQIFDDDVDTWRAVVHIKLGELGPAVEWARSKGYAVTDEFRLNQGLHYRCFARLLIAQQRIPDAMTVLDRLLELARRSGLAGTAIVEGLVLMALAEAQRGERERTYEVLGQALAYGEPGGFIRAFVDEGEPMAALLRGLRGPVTWGRYAALLGISRAYVDRLIDAFDQTTFALDASHADANAALIEPLSERELDVLRLLAQGKANRAIADELFVAVGTVKAHTYNVYQKLGVSGRTQAVIRARELGLL
jgi:LuxR family maltose regulon positive regulatory protein